MNQSSNLGAQSFLGPSLRRREREAPAEMPLVDGPRFDPGDRVRVCCGAFADVEGSVISRPGDGRVLIAIDLRQRGVTLEVDDSALEPVGFSAPLD